MADIHAHRDFAGSYRGEPALLSIFFRPILTHLLETAILINADDDDNGSGFRPREQRPADLVPGAVRASYQRSPPPALVSPTETARSINWGSGDNNIDPLAHRRDRSPSLLSALRCRYDSDPLPALRPRLFGPCPHILLTSELLEHPTNWKITESERPDFNYEYASEAYTDHFNLFIFEELTNLTTALLYAGRYGKKLCATQRRKIERLRILARPRVRKLEVRRIRPIERVAIPTCAICMDREIDTIMDCGYTLYKEYIHPPIDPRCYIYRQLGHYRRIYLN